MIYLFKFSLLVLSSFEIQISIPPFIFCAAAPELPVSICCLGLLYCRTDGIVGQTRQSGEINLIDLSLLPLTPVLGDGSAPMQVPAVTLSFTNQTPVAHYLLQPQEVGDAATRITYLAVTDPDERFLSVFTIEFEEKKISCISAWSARASSFPYFHFCMDFGGMITHSFFFTIHTRHLRGTFLSLLQTLKH